MTPPLAALFVGAGCFAAHVLFTLVLLRVPGRMPPVARHAASALFTHVGGVVVAGLALGSLPYWPIAAASGFGAVGWLFAFSAVYKSVSLRILSRLAEAPDNAIPFDVVTAVYVLPEFETRVGVLTTMGCVEPAGGGHALTAKGAATAKKIVAVQALCGIERSGLYGGSADTETEADKKAA